MNLPKRTPSRPLHHFLLTGSPSVVAKATLAQLFIPRVSADEGSQYGYGLRISGTTDKTVYFHTGSGNGFTSYNEIRPANGLSLTVLSNLGTANIRAIGQAPGYFIK